MFSLFFGDLWEILSTVTLLFVLGYIVLSIIKQKEIAKWGRKILFLALIGLFLCIFVAMRDEYVVSAQGMIDGTGTVGLFAIDSWQSNFACLGGAVIALSSLSSVFVRNQKYRKIMFFILSGTILLKALLVELSRITML